MAKEWNGAVLAWHSGSQRCFGVAKRGSSHVLGADGRDSNGGGRSQSRVYRFAHFRASPFDSFGVDDQHGGADLLREVAASLGAGQVEGTKDATVQFCLALEYLFIGITGIIFTKFQIHIYF
jgi:hypothetical protein